MRGGREGGRGGREGGREGASGDGERRKGGRQRGSEGEREREDRRGGRRTNPSFAGHVPCLATHCCHLPAISDVLECDEEALHKLVFLAF